MLDIVHALAWVRHNIANFGGDPNTVIVAELGLGRGQVRELQKRPVDQIMLAYFSVVRRKNLDRITRGFSPVVDGKTVPQHPFLPRASDVSATVPVMFGTTRTELTLSADSASFSLSEQGLRGRIQTLLGDHADSAIQIYRKANPGATPSDLYFLIATDRDYTAHVMKNAERRAALCHWWRSRRRGSCRQNQRRVDFVRQIRESEHVQTAAMASVQPN